MKILAGIDLPLDEICGSMLLAKQLYDSSSNDIRFFGLKSSGVPLLKSFGLRVLKSGPDEHYVDSLTDALRAGLGDWRPDIVHCHHLAYGMSVALLNMKLAAPTIAIAHGTDIFDARDDPAVLSTVIHVTSECDITVYPTLALMREAGDIGIPIVPTKVRIVPWGVGDVPVRRTPRPPVDGFRILVAGRMTENKDFATAIRAMSHLPEGYHLELVGGGREEGSLRKLTYDLGLQGRVAFRKMVPQADLWTSLSEFDCAVFPTRQTEAFGLVGLEYQAAGMPLVTSDLPVFHEVFGASALHFRRGDSEDLAAQIRVLAENRALADLLADLAIVNSKRFAIKSTLQRIDELGHSLVASTVG